MSYCIASFVQQKQLCSEALCAAWQVPTLLARAAGMPEGMLNNGLSGHQHRAANKAVSGLKVNPEIWRRLSLLLALSGIGCDHALHVCTTVCR